jgi:5-methylcytosine-specific restriction endonuclease McrA
MPSTSTYSAASTLGAFSKYRALLLDTTYRPIDIVNWQRAICLDMFDKVDVLEYYDICARSARDEFMLPAVMRVRMYVQRDRKGRIPLSRRNILLRDSFMCQYCGSKNMLTVDHVMPASKGGKWDWTNLVTACNKCNNKKGSKTLKQLGWKLKKAPVEPSAWQVGVMIGGDTLAIKSMPKEWSEYLYHTQGVVREAEPETSAATENL